MRRVVVTGVGLRTALGHTPTALFDALLQGRSAARHMPEWERFGDLECHVAAPVVDFDGKEIPRKFRRSMGRVAQLAVAAAVDATRSADLQREQLASERVAVILGSTTGSNHASEEFWTRLALKGTSRGLKSTHFLKVMAHTAATNVAMYLGTRGESLSTNAACASATQAMGAALDRIRAGRIDVAIAGGADELHAAAAITFDSMGGASRGFNDRPQLTPRPFDAARDGIVVGEGAGVLVLEALDHGLARGAPILAEVLGYAGYTDGENMASPAAEGMERVVRLALADAGVEAHQLGYINAHATATVVGDAAEAEALGRVVGDRVPISSTKGHLGHTLGSCGAMEAITCIEAMHRGVLPHTLHLEHPEPQGLDLLQQPREASIELALSTNFAFGGINTAVVLGRFRQ